MGGKKKIQTTDPYATQTNRTGGQSGWDGEIGQKNLYRLPFFRGTGKRGEDVGGLIRRAFLLDLMLLKSEDDDRDEGSEVDDSDSFGNDSKRQEKRKEEESSSMHSDAAMEGPVGRELGW